MIENKSFSRPVSTSYAAVCRAVYVQNLLTLNFSWKFTLTL